MFQTFFFSFSDIHAIEFQKRDLLHAYILIAMDQNHKISTIKDIDDIVSAKIPNITKIQSYMTRLSTA